MWSLMYCPVSPARLCKVWIDVTSDGQRSSPWPCKLEITFRIDHKLHFLGAQFRLGRTHWTNLSVTIEAKYRASWIILDELFECVSCVITADSKSRWPHGRKAQLLHPTPPHPSPPTPPHPSPWQQKRGPLSSPGRSFPASSTVLVFGSAPSELDRQYVVFSE